MLALTIMAVLIAGARCATSGKVGLALAKGSTPTNLMVAAKCFGGTAEDISKMEVKGQGSDKWIDMSNAGAPVRELRLEGRILYPLKALLPSVTQQRRARLL
ncbi:hypothetical protein ZWY2020_011651 [Hordeum vulgare]|nr:hypothetical protein ZWY2020_011651 [Hordeum vulgare]